MIRLIEERDLYRCWQITKENWDEVIADNALFQMEQGLGIKEEHPYAPEAPRFYVWEEDGVVVAYSGMRKSWIMAGVWDFIWINVHREHRGKKIGRYLTLHRISEVARLGGSVIMLMTKEYPFFEKFGFRINRVIDGWAHMSLQLKGLEI